MGSQGTWPTQRSQLPYGIHIRLIFAVISGPPVVLRDMPWLSITVFSSFRARLSLCRSLIDQLTRSLFEPSPGLPVSLSVLQGDRSPTLQIPPSPDRCFSAQQSTNRIVSLRRSQRPQREPLMQERDNQEKKYAILLCRHSLDRPLTLSPNLPLVPLTARCPLLFLLPSSTS